MNNASTSLLASLYQWTWQASLAATVLAGLIVVLTVVLRAHLPARWSYILWLLVVIRLALPSPPQSNLSLFNSLAPPPALAPPKALPPPQTFVPPSPPSPQAQPLPPAPHPTAARAFNLLPFLWIAGTTCFLLVVLLQQNKLARWARRQKPLQDHPAKTLLDETRAALGLKRPVALIVTGRVPVPALFGFWRPRLLIPASVFSQLDTAELRLVLLHELVHVKRRDVLLNWFTILLQALHWFNPAVWFAMKRFRAARETVCDADVLARLNPAERQIYGATLIKLLPSLTPTRPVAGLVSLFHYKQEIHQRITMISKFKPIRPSISITCALLAIALVCLTFTRAAESEEPKLARENTKTDTIDKAGLDVLKDQLQILDRKIREKDEELLTLRRHQGIPSYVTSGDSAAFGPEAEKLRKLQSLLVEAEIESQQAQVFYQTLLQLSANDLKHAIPASIAPDNILAALESKLSGEQQRLAGATAIYGEDHPTVKEAKHTIEQVNQQIEEHLAGVLKGLEIKVLIAKAKAESLRKQVAMAQNADFEADANHRSYAQTKRELDAHLAQREKLRARIFQARIDAALSHTKDPQLLP